MQFHRNCSLKHLTFSPLLSSLFTTVLPAVFLGASLLYSSGVQSQEVTKELSVPLQKVNTFKGEHELSAVNLSSKTRSLFIESNGEGYKGVLSFNLPKGQKLPSKKDIENVEFSAQVTSTSLLEYRAWDNCKKRWSKTKTLKSDFPTQQKVALLPPIECLFNSSGTAKVLLKSVDSIGAAQLNSPAISVKRRGGKGKLTPTPVSTSTLLPTPPPSSTPTTVPTIQPTVPVPFTPTMQATPTIGMPTSTPRPTSTSVPTATPTKLATSTPTIRPTATFTPTSLPTATPPIQSGNWWKPAPGLSWQIQYTGSINTSVGVKVYDLDLFDTSAATIEQLHAKGAKVICYFSGGSYEDWRPDASKFPSAVLGKGLDGWPGEKWLDVRRWDLLGPVMSARLDLAVQKKCDAVDPDNMDGYSNDSGFSLSGNDQIAYNKALAQAAHARGLAVGLKNDLDQVAALASTFDFAVNEQCFEYNECDLLLPFVKQNKPVYGIEYSSNPSVFCPKANQMNMDFLKKKLALDEYRVDCRSGY